MNLSRKYKLNKYFGTSLSEEEIYIISFIENWLTDLKIYTNISYPNQKFYFNQFNECVIVIDTIDSFNNNYNHDNRYYIRGNGFWDVIIKELGSDNSISILKFFIPNDLVKKEMFVINNQTLFTHIEELYKYEYNKEI